MPTNFDPYSYHIHTTFAGRVAYMEFCFFFKGISKNNRQTCELWICVPVWTISAAILLEGWCISFICWMGSDWDEATQLSTPTIPRMAVPNGFNPKIYVQIWTIWSNPFLGNLYISGTNWSSKSGFDLSSLLSMNLFGLCACWSRHGEDLPDLAELQKANDNVQAFSCCGWMPLFETTGHLPVSHTSRNNLLRHRFFWTWNPDHNVRGLHDSSCPGKALLKTFCDALRKQRLERQKVQVQLVTGDFEWRWPTD